MRPVNRHSVSKHKSSNQFKRNTRTTHRRNIASAPMRGGWRL